MDHRMRRRLTGAVVGLLLLGAAPAADAHIQVTPAAAAPGDSVRFTVLVPGERRQSTRRVELKVPGGVLPFAFARTPGWTCRTVPSGNGGIARIVWTGRLAADGFVEFSFLAGTPDRPGVIAWKALQVYSDGAVVRWIGPPGSEQPAPVTRVVSAQARQNAGGEGGGSGSSTASSRAASTPVARRDWGARAIAAAALLVAITSLVLSRRRPGRRRP
jgi:uncharacterized protein YcnI